MAYCTIDNVIRAITERELIKLTDDPEDRSNAVNESVVTETISGADGEIDEYIGTRYAVPLTTVPVIIRELSIEITILKLYKMTVGPIPPKWEEAYKAATKKLERIATGKLLLPQGESSGGFGFSVVTSDHFG